MRKSRLGVLGALGVAGWNVQSKAQSGTVPGTTQVTLLQIDYELIEGFGKLELAPAELKAKRALRNARRKATPAVRPIFVNCEASLGLA